MLHVMLNMAQNYEYLMIESALNVRLSLNLEFCYIKDKMPDTTKLHALLRTNLDW